MRYFVESQSGQLGKKGSESFNATIYWAHHPPSETRTAPVIKPEALSDASITAIPFSSSGVATLRNGVWDSIISPATLDCSGVLLSVSGNLVPL
jgi:hypothetical protein